VIRRPGHLANGAPSSGAPAPIAGLDLALAARNVASAGGDAGRFGAALAAAQRAGFDDADGLAVVGVAGWRAGVLALRDDALRHLDELVGRRPAVAAAALGLAESDLPAFLERQRSDRFWWPDRAAANGYVCAIGGFTGLGGAWVAPPAEARPLAADGAFAVRTHEQWWRLDADVWGSRLVQLDAEPAAAAPAAASVVVFADSYLAWVHVREAA
jgi:hypothetical protein